MTASTIEIPVGEIKGYEHDLRRIGWRLSKNVLINRLNVCPYPPYQPTSFYLKHYSPLDTVVAFRHPLDVWKQYAYLLQVLPEKEYVEWLNR